MICSLSQFIRPLYESVLRIEGINYVALWSVNLESVSIEFKMSDSLLRLSIAEIATACFDFRIAFDFEILQFFLGVVAWCYSAFASMSIVNSFSGWKDSVISIWFRRPPRKPPDGFDSSVLRIARSQWSLSVHTPKIPQDQLIVGLKPWHPHCL